MEKTRAKEKTLDEGRSRSSSGSIPCRTVSGWWTILQIVDRRTTESITFAVPDRNASWSRAEDDLVQAVGKCSTSNILGRDWIEIAWEMSGRLLQQCQEDYSLVHICSELTFVFLCVTFRDRTKRTGHLPRTHPPYVPVLTLLPMITLLDIVYTKVQGFFSQPSYPLVTFRDPYDL